MSDWPSAAAPTEAWVHLDTQVLSVAAATITFSGIAAVAAPRLRLYLYMVNDGTAGHVLIRFNNDVATNYNSQLIGADAATVTAVRTAGGTFWRTQAPSGTVVGADQPAMLVMEVEKPVSGEVGRGTYRFPHMSNDGTPVIMLEEGVGEWTNTDDLINRIDLAKNAGNFDTGTRAVLEGVST